MAAAASGCWEKRRKRGNGFRELVAGGLREEQKRGSFGCSGEVERTTVGVVLVGFWTG